MAQPVKRLTLDFSSGHDLVICEYKPPIGLHSGSVEPVLDSLSPSLSAPLQLTVTLSLKVNK